MQERVFLSPGAVDICRLERLAAYGGLNDGVDCSWLLTPQPSGSELAGIQVHATKCSTKPKVISIGQSASGRTIGINGIKYITVSGLPPSVNGSVQASARSVFEDAELILKQAGGDLRSIARTWFWLGDILGWYNDFNKVRNGFFHEKGILDNASGKCSLPASTGIGVYAEGWPCCALDLIAVIADDSSQIEHFLAAGNQGSAADYGSAFSRASRVKTPGGETLFVSGTASIGLDGQTQHSGDIKKQIKTTIDNIRRVLDDAGCHDDEIVQAIAYCKTPKVESVWQEIGKDLGWPCITVLADICRDDLLFELEATAASGARKLHLGVG